MPPSPCPRTGTGADGNVNSGSGKVWMTCFVDGDKDETINRNQDVLVGLNFDNSGIDEHLSNKQGMGSIWSLAYDEWSGVLYSGAFLKCHVELGPEGLDGLYWMDYSDGVSPTETDFSTSLGANFGADPVGRDVDTATPGDGTYDADVFDRITDTGIGDIDLSPDGRILSVMNLETKTLEVFDVSSIAANPQPDHRFFLTPGPSRIPDVPPTAPTAISRLRSAWKTHRPPTSA